MPKFALALVWFYGQYGCGGMKLFLAKKKIPFLFTGRFQGNLLDKVMSRLQNKENGQILKWVCRILNTFANHGWPSFKRISFI